MARALPGRKPPQSSDERCRAAFNAWWKSVNTYHQHMYRGDDIAYEIWAGCWHYLERQAVKEFIER